MDGCVLLTSTPSCVVSPRGETTHSGVDVNNTHPSMINPLNHPGCFCLLAEQPCVRADEIDGFSMVILRLNEPQHCVEWVPFNRTYGLENGFPERAFQVAKHGGETSAVARAVEVNITLAGRVNSDKYTAYLLNSTGALFNLDQGYEILVVGDTCSTAWVPHSVQNPIPAGAVVAGKDSLNRNHYVVGRTSQHIRIGRFIEAESAGHYSTGAVFSPFTNMFILVAVVWICLLSVAQIPRKI